MKADRSSTPFRREGLPARVAPFAAVAVLAAILAVVPPRIVDSGTAIAAGVLTVAIFATTHLLSWARLPRIVEVVPPALYLAVVGLLIASQGDADSAFEPLAILPVFWIALHGTRAQLWILTVCVALALIVPLIAIGGPDSPNHGYKWALLWVAVSGVIGFTVQGLVADVRKKGRAAAIGETEARSAGERLAAIVDNSSSVISLKDLGGRYLVVNPRFVELFVPSGMEVVGTTDDEVFDRATADMVRENDRMVLRHGDSLEFEESIPVDGAPHSFAAVRFPIRDSSGEIYGVCAIATDITERKRFERFLAAQEAVSRALAVAATTEEAMRAVLERVGRLFEWDLGIVWIENAGDGELRASAAWEGDLEISDALRAQLFAPRLVSGPALQALADAEPDWIEDVGSVPGYARRQAVEALSLRTVVTSPIVAGDRAIGIVELFCKRRRALDDRLVRLIGGVARLVGQYLAQKQVESEAVRVKEEFFALVSHEFRTPLTSIVGYVEILRDSGIDGDLSAEERQRFLRVIERNAHRLERLVGDLLFAARVESGTFEIRSESVDIVSVARDAVEAMGPRSAARGVDLALDAGEVPEIAGDRERLGQVVDNLISNAVKFTSEGGSVCVHVGTHRNTVAISVADTGIGVATTEQHRLFERFFRASGAAAAEVPGIGLGLSISKTIVEAHGGRIRFSSTEGRGTVFSVEIPFMQSGAMSDPDKGTA